MNRSKPNAESLIGSLRASPARTCLTIVIAVSLILQVCLTVMVLGLSSESQTIEVNVETLQKQIDAQEKSILDRQSTLLKRSRTEYEGRFKQLSASLTSWEQENNRNRREQSVQLEKLWNTVKLIEKNHVAMIMAPASEVKQTVDSAPAEKRLDELVDTLKRLDQVIANQAILAKRIDTLAASFAKQAVANAPPETEATVPETRPMEKLDTGDAAAQGATAGNSVSGSNAAETPEKVETPQKPLPAISDGAKDQLLFVKLDEQFKPDTDKDVLLLFGFENCKHCKVATPLLIDHLLTNGLYREIDFFFVNPVDAEHRAKFYAQSLLKKHPPKTKAMFGVVAENWRDKLKVSAMPMWFLMTRNPEGELQLKTKGLGVLTSEQLTELIPLPPAPKDTP